MPFYCFKSNSGKVEDLYFHMNDAPSIGSKIIYEGIEMVRLATKPNASIDSVEGDPFDRNSFIKATNKAGGTMGSMWDLSKEFSERRAAKDGIDPVAEKYNKKREELTGIPALTDNSKKLKAQERLKKLGVSVKEKKLKR